MARISEVIHVKYNGEVQECALFSASSDIPSPASAREFALNGATVYGAVLTDSDAIAGDANWLWNNNDSGLRFYGGEHIRRLLTTPYFVRPLVDTIAVGADGGTFATGDLISTNGNILVVGTPDTGYVTTSESGVTVSANTGSSSRFFTVDVIVLFADGSTQQITLIGTQDAAANTITVSPTSWSADAGGGSGTVQVTATAEWSVSAITASWLTVSPTGGSAGTTAVTITASANTGTSSRSGSIDFMINATGEKATLTVMQEAAPERYTLTVRFSTSSNYVPTLTVEGTRDGKAVTDTQSGSNNTINTYTGEFDRNTYVSWTCATKQNSSSGTAYMDRDRTITVADDDLSRE